MEFDSINIFAGAIEPQDLLFLQPIVLQEEHREHENDLG